MFATIISALFWYVLAFIFAGLEVEAEGKYGWAEKMPTWYRTRGIVARLYGLAMAGKPLTGYHSFMFFLPLLVFHAPFFMGVDWTAAKELVSLAMYFAWCPLWDFLWFVLNPAYGWANFSKAKVWWHARDKWLLGFPLGYYVAWAVSTGLAFAASHLAQDRQIMHNHGMMLALFVICTGVTIIFSPLYHRWYNGMRQRDDRDDAGIKHS